MLTSFRFKMLIVGGGPAGTAIMVRAIRLGYLAELCSGSTATAGVCIVEKGPENRFGGGRLLDYEVTCGSSVSQHAHLLFVSQINSNTWGDKFATNVTIDKPNCMPPEAVTGTALEKLRKVFCLLLES
jgi:hypothetical protein